MSIFGVKITGEIHPRCDCATHPKLMLPFQIALAIAHKYFARNEGFACPGSTGAPPVSDRALAIADS
jgi:hypothetical protein